MRLIVSLILSSVMLRRSIHAGASKKNLRGLTYNPRHDSLPTLP